MKLAASLESPLKTVYEPNMIRTRELKVPVIETDRTNRKAGRKPSARITKSAVPITL